MLIMPMINFDLYFRGQTWKNHLITADHNRKLSYLLHIHTLIKRCHHILRKSLILRADAQAGRY